MVWHHPDLIIEDWSKGGEWSEVVDIDGEMGPWIGEGMLENIG